MQEDWSRRGYLGGLTGLVSTLAGVPTGDRDRADGDGTDADVEASAHQTITLRIPEEVADDLDVEAGDSVLYQGTN
jgi:hypothetical protein